MDQSRLDVEFSLVENALGIYLREADEDGDEDAYALKEGVSRRSVLYALAEDNLHRADAGEPELSLDEFAARNTHFFKWEE